MQAVSFPKYSLREMAEADLKMVNEWRNHPTVRSNSTNTEKIPLKQQRYWFDCSVDSIKLIFQVDEKPEGVVVYDKRTSYWSFYLRPTGRIHNGFGRLMLSMFLVYAKDIGLTQIRAKVYTHNEPSIFLHFSLGFRDTIKSTKEAMEFYKPLVIKEESNAIY